MIAIDNSDKCLGCSGLSPKSKRGFTVWDNQSWCNDCNKVVDIIQKERFKTIQGWDGIAVYCPIHEVQL